MRTKYKYQPTELGKICTKCDLDKSLTEYYKDPKRHDGYFSACKECSNKAYYEADRKRRAIKKLNKPLKKYKHPGKPGSPEYARSSRLFTTYGLTLEDFNKIYTEQKGCCWICGISQLELDKPLSVDHDHLTGKVRGLLCNNHNIALGLFKDNIDLLEKAIEYLKKNK